MTLTLEEAQERIRKNFSTRKTAQSRREPLQWDRQTATTIVSTCGTFLISEAARVTRKGMDQAWTLFQVRTGQPPLKIGGPFISAHRARMAADDYGKGEPMQLDLA